MKKKLCSIFLFVFSMLLISGCVVEPAKEIKSITVQGETAYPVYLYYFENAVMSDENFEFLNDTHRLAFEECVKSGYFLSSTDYSIGDTINVSLSLFYGEEGLDFDNVVQRTYSDLNARVSVSVLEKEKFELSYEEKTDTFIITGYFISSNGDVDESLDRTNRSAVPSIGKTRDVVIKAFLKEEIIEVAKENVIISYE